VFELIRDLKLYKMHSCSNDFVVIDLRSSKYTQVEIQQLSSRIADRDKGIGCDQVLALSPSAGADCTIHVYNNDGSESGMCANGLRCVGRLLSEEKDRNNISIEISGEIYKTKRKSPTLVSVNVGKPKILWHEIPLARDMPLPALKYSCGGFENPIVLNVGNPHAVFFVEQSVALEKIDLARIGRKIENDSLFPEKINVSFVKIRDKENLEARVWERGSGETKSCGSAASAIAWASFFNGNITTASAHVHFGTDRTIAVKLLEDGSLESTAETHMVCRKKTFKAV